MRRGTFGLSSPDWRQTMARRIDLIGQSFGRLKVIERATNQGTFARWLCQCECGKSITALGIHLRSGHTKSCGCFAREVWSHKAKQIDHVTHNMSRSKLYSAWSAMIQRCVNPKAASYRWCGVHDIGNMCISCIACNMQKGTRTITEWN